MRTSTLTALAALASDDPSHKHHSHQFSNSRLQLYPSPNVNHNAVLQSSQYPNILGIRGGDAAGGRVGVSFGEILTDNKTSYKISTATNPSVIVRGGDDKSSTTTTTSSSSISLFGLQPTPQALATLSMATCMALHYLAYSLARPATMTLFTSSRLGFGGNKSAYPFAMTFISPMSFMLLLFYGKVLQKQGPYLALKTTTLGCASILGLASLTIAKLDSLISDGNDTLTTITKYIVGLLFIFRESYVQLITSQHWSFISSILTPSQSSMWFAPISGLTSITSALSAMGVGKLSNLWGLPGVLGLAATVLGGSVVFGEMAYNIAEKNGFNPANEHNRKKKQSKESNKQEEDSLIVKARDVFTREPTLWALFREILACQGLSTFLNVCTVTKVSEVIPDDNERAGYMGNFFALINVLSGILQFGILPAASSFIEPSMLWKGMPMIMLVMTSLLAFPRLTGGAAGSDPTLNMVASAFLVMKTLEFSVRRMLDELVYVPLDYESRFLGKEVIGVLGFRFGKSAASLAMSTLTSTLGAGLRELSYVTTGAASMWLVMAWRLSALVPSRAEAEENYKKMKEKG